MPLPEITFDSKEDQLKYGINALMEAGFSVQEIETVRKKYGLGASKIPYSKEATGQRRYMVQSLLAANLSNAQIAEVLELSKQTVHADRGHNRQLWTAEILRSQDTWRAKLIRDQDELKAKALEAFENSKRRKVTTIKEGPNNDGEALVRYEESAGESSFLTVAKGCLEQQARLIGLFDIRPQSEEKSGYKAFLDTLGREVQKIKQAENDGLIETTAETADDSSPLQPILQASELPLPSEPSQ